MADSTEIVSVEILLLRSRGQVLPSVCSNSSLWPQCGATVAQVHRGTGSLCVQNWDINIFLLLRQNHGTTTLMGDRIETYTNGVRSKSLTVEKLNGKIVDFWYNDINVGT